MSKKIVIAPVFCDTHLIKYQIPNIIETINPDYIIYNEGMFPTGPESNTEVTSKFIENFTLDGHRGFDYEELKGIVSAAQKKYPDTKIILNEMDYPKNLSSPECYVLACTNFSDFGINVEVGDYLFPFEGDVFHHENSKKEIQGYLEQLKPDTGFKSIWLDFLETQYYCERSTLKPILDGLEGRSRKIAICYGTDEFYKSVLLNLMTQQYPMLYPTDLITYHYAMWRPGKYRELRYAQLNRKSGYWNYWENAMKQIKNNGNVIKDDIVIRPDAPLTATSRFASFYEIEHPKHIKAHSNYLK